MDVTQAVEQIKRDFGDEYDVIINNTDIYKWIYAAELEIIRSAGSNDQTVTAAANVFPQSVPASVSIKRVAINGRSLLYITKDELDDLGQQVTLSGNTQPFQWYRENNQVHLWPATTLTDQVQITYNKTPTLMTGLPSANVFTVPERYHPDIVNYVLARAYSKAGYLSKEKLHQDLWDRNIGARRDEADAIDAPIYKAVDPMDYNEYDYWT